MSESEPLRGSSPNKRGGPNKHRKIAVLGFRAVGKSTMIIQYVDGHFVPHYNPTIENTYHKNISYNGETFDMEIVDTAGQDEFSILHSQYSLGIHGYMLIYAVTSKSSLDMVKIINEKILNYCGTESVPRCLVGNKSDLDFERQVSKDTAKALAADWGCAFCECSAKLNQGIDEAFRLLIAEVEKVNNPQQTSSGSCCVLL